MQAIYLINDPQNLVDSSPKNQYNQIMTATTHTTSENSLVAMVPRAHVIRGAARFLPHTQEGLPAGFFRADMIPPEVTAAEAKLPSTTDAAFVPLNYQEGFPALPDGRPFWHKLDYEPPIAFAAFELYTELAKTGPRHLALLLGSVELQRLYGESLNMALLQELHSLYYWKERSRAYDLYQEAAYRHIRTRRAQSMEDYHYIQSESLLQKVMSALNSAETFEAMKHDPSLLLSAMEKLVKIQRVSVGLPATAPAESLKGGDGATSNFEMILRQVAQRNVSPETNSQNTTVDEAGRVIPTTDNLLRGALNDPQSAKQLQEIIIRMSTSHGATKQPRWAGTYSEAEQAEIDDESRLD